MSWVRSNRESAQRGTPIIGPPSARLGQAVQWAIVKGATEGFLDAQGIAWMEAPRVGRGVDPVAVAAVMAHETAFGRYGGVVPESFNNWGGIKTTSGGSDTDPDAHARFPSRRAGVLAVIEHLHLYAAGPVPFPHDPRHFDRLAGIAPTFEDPDYQWGHDPRRIVALMKEIQSQTPGSVDLWIDRNGWPSYARDAIAWAIDRGLFLGHETGDGRREFRPDEPVTRAQLAVVLQRLQSPS